MAQFDRKWWRHNSEITSNTEGFLLGFFFSLLGVLVEALLPKSEHSTYSILTKKVYKDLILLFFILLAIGFLGILMS